MGASLQNNKAMHVSGLYIYPLKGGAAISLAEATVTSKGLEYDRALMAVHPGTGKFVTQRENPGLASVKALPDDTGIVLSAPGMDALRLMWGDMKRGEILQANLWDKPVDARVQSKTAAEWLSKAIGQDVALVYQSPEMKRETSPQYAPGGEVSFADGYPLLVAFTSSLNDLNERITGAGGAPVPMERFRPNIVIENNTPWEEDTIGQIKVGTITLTFVKPCTRCVVTTVNQTTAIKEGPEPLRTLATFRFSPAYKGVLFAENAVPSGRGKIKVGDPVGIVVQKEKPEIVLRKSK